MAGRRGSTDSRKAVRRLAWGLAGATLLALVALWLLPGRPGSDGEPGGEVAAPGREQARPPVEQTQAVESGYRRTDPGPATPEPPRTGRTAPQGTRPRVAIIIDDAGRSMGPVDDLIQLGIPVTLAVIPNLPYSEQAARRAAAHGLEVILHQPMEPVGYPGVPVDSGAILVGMLPREVERILSANLASVPGARGINNHMGSRATQDPTLMRTFLTATSKRGLYFIDSRTTAETVAEEVARQLRVPTARRHVFLDNDRQVDRILDQIDQLIAKARENGFAIGIGHADPRMVRALELAWSRLMEGEVKMVPASSLVD